MGAVTPPAAVIRGACLCGGIEVDVTALAGAVVYCHCSQCRKTAGAPFLAVVPVLRVDFELRDPQRLLAQHRASSNKARYFCGRCGAPIYSHRDGAETVRVRAGILELPATVARGGHIYCADVPAWAEFQDDLPRHPALEPGRT